MELGLTLTRSLDYELDSPGSWRGCSSEAFVRALRHASALGRRGNCGGFVDGGLSRLAQAATLSGSRSVWGVVDGCMCVILMVLGSMSLAARGTVAAPTCVGLSVVGVSPSSPQLLGRADADADGHPHSGSACARG